MAHPVLSRTRMLWIVAIVGSSLGEHASAQEASCESGLPIDAVGEVVAIDDRRIEVQLAAGVSVSVRDRLVFYDVAEPQSECREQPAGHGVVVAIAHGRAIVAPGIEAHVRLGTRASLPGPDPVNYAGPARAPFGEVSLTYGIGRGSGRPIAHFALASAELRGRRGVRARVATAPLFAMTRRARANDLNFGASVLGELGYEHDRQAFTVGGGVYVLTSVSGSTGAPRAFPLVSGTYRYGSRDGFFIETGFAVRVVHSTSPRTGAGGITRLEATAQVPFPRRVQLRLHVLADTVSIYALVDAGVRVAITPATARHPVFVRAALGCVIGETPAPLFGMGGIDVRL